MGALQPTDATCLPSTFHTPRSSPPLVSYPSVVTYPGGANGNETLYLDGVATTFKLQTLEIGTPPFWYLGAWYTSPTIFGGEFGIGALRMHDHALTAAQVAYNYNVDYAWYHTSPTPTPTATKTSTATPSSSDTASGTASPSGTSSSTASPSGTVIVSLSNTPSGSQTATVTPSSSATSTSTPTATSTRTPTTTSTASQRIQTAGLLVDMQAIDYNAATNTWDNRITPGPVSFANGDFIATAGAGTYPTATTFNLAPAVYFSGTASGAAQYMQMNASLSLYNGIYANSDWTVEAWLLHQGSYNLNAESTSAPESPFFQFGVRNGSTCVSAHFGIGDAADGAAGHWNCDFGFAPSPFTVRGMPI